MNSDKVPILKETNDFDVQVETAPRIDDKKRPYFKDVYVRKLALLHLLLGCVSFLLGFVIEILAFFIPCERYCYGIYVSQVGTGMWCGLLIFAAGFVGLLAARRKTTCFIVAMMTVYISLSLVALLEVILSIAAMVHDKEKVVVTVRPSVTEHFGNERERLHEYDRVVYSIPVSIFILNLLLAIVGIVAFLTMLTSAALSCAATCCDPKPYYLQVNLYEPVSTRYSEPMTSQMQPPIMPGRQMYYAPQGFGSPDSGRLHPIILMPSNQQFQVSPYQAPHAPYTDPQSYTSYGEKSHFVEMSTQTM